MIGAEKGEEEYKSSTYSDLDSCGRIDTLQQKIRIK